MKGLILMMMATLFGLSSCAEKNLRTEVYKTHDGTEVTFKFFGHASLAMETGGKWIYLDPVNEYGDFCKEHKADAVLITHSHFDHLDVKALKSLADKHTAVYCDSVSAEKIGEQQHAAMLKSGAVMKPGKVITMLHGIQVEAVPAYNMTAGHTQFHPKERHDCGYIFTIGGSRIYIAGDTENTPELKALKDIDVAFLPVNQPYTMTVAQAADAIKAIRPKVFYPYHYGGTDQHTDLDKLAKEVKPYTEMRIRDME
jgi:L-ascorbate metabolism protein UlaG (beta-lactamase superfamily)